MPAFQGLFWRLDVPEGWRVERDADGVTLHPPTGLGVLRITSVRKRQGLVSDEELREIVAGEGIDPATAEPVELGWFRGYADAHERHGERRRRWCLRHGVRVLLITHTCPLDDAGPEDVAVDAVLATLRPHD